MMQKHIYNIIPDIQDERDFNYTSYVKGEPLPSSVDLSSKIPFVFNQLDLGSCGLNAGIMYVMYLYGFNIPMLSRLYPYLKVREIMGTVNEDSGVQLRDVCKVFVKFGACIEDMFPYLTKTFANPPTDEKIMDENAIKHRITSYYRVRNLDEYKLALSKGHLVFLGMRVFESMETQEVARTGILPMPKRNEKLMGGHAVLGCSYKDNLACSIKKFLMKIVNSYSKGNGKILNSWGEDWGQKGFFEMSYEFYEEHVTDAWVLILEEV